jgi:2-C-methyl-D-erythritol 4-phosphate cytidylyltransferase
MLVHAVRAALAASGVCCVGVAAPPEELGAVHAQLDRLAATAQVIIVAGGSSRQQSVAAALAALPDGVDVVLVHDAARPLTPASQFDVVAEAVRAGHDAVVPGLAVTDTIKQVGVDGRVLGTPARVLLRAIQTPQGFRREILAAAHAASESATDAPTDAATTTDDAGLVERMGGSVYVVPGHEEAFKVTHPLDLLLAEAVLGARRTQPA